MERAIERVRILISEEEGHFHYINRRIGEKLNREFLPGLGKKHTVCRAFTGNAQL